VLWYDTDVSDVYVLYTLPQHYTSSQPRRIRLGELCVWKYTFWTICYKFTNYIKTLILQ